MKKSSGMKDVVLTKRGGVGKGGESQSGARDPSPPPKRFEFVGKTFNFHRRGKIRINHFFM